MCKPNSILIMQLVAQECTNRCAGEETAATFGPQHTVSAL